MYTCITMLSFTKGNIVFTWYFLIFSQNVRGESSWNQEGCWNLLYITWPRNSYMVTTIKTLNILKSIRQFWINSFHVYVNNYVVILNIDNPLFNNSDYFDLWDNYLFILAVWLSLLAVFYTFVYIKWMEFTWLLWLSYKGSIFPNWFKS